MRASAVAEPATQSRLQWSEGPCPEFRREGPSGIKPAVARMIDKYGAAGVVRAMEPPPTPVSLTDINR